jgi:phage terminase large subunit-like protein
LITHDASKFYFDEKAAQRACDFFGEIVHVKGKLANKPLTLQPWQRDGIIRPLFGWKRLDGTRRYRNAYIEVPRKNGKSTLCAGIALYLLFCDGEEGAEVYSAAGTRDQALMVFDPACEMISRCEWLSEVATLRKSVKRVIYEKTASYYRAVAADGDAIHGTNPHGVIFDELHVQPDRNLWDSFQTGQGARTQPLTIAITTAGFDRSSICWEQHQYAARLLDPNDDFQDDTFLPVIYGADAEDDWTSEATWKKANPNYGVSVSPEFLAEHCEKAKQSPSYENTFRRLYLNQWTEQAVRWLPMHAWDACRQDFDPRDLAGRDCWAGLDLANTRDVNALVLVFPEDDGFIVLPVFWIPREHRTERDGQDRTQVTNWAREKLVRQTPGNTTDYRVIADDIAEIAKTYRICGMAYDPWNANNLAQNLQDEGLEMVEFRQTLANFAGPTKELEKLVVSGKLIHDGNPVLRWMAGNVTVKEDQSGNIRPDKGKSADKIDGIVALIMALALALNGAGGPSVYEDRGILTL